MLYLLPSKGKGKSSGLYAGQENAGRISPHYALSSAEEENRYVAMHHPFTAPKEDGLELLETDPSKVCARAYDMVLNGNEVGGGSIRINNPELQQRMFKALGFTEQDAQERFGFLIDAFRYGAPPHGGMAFGLDRLVMLMLGGESIRDVIAFPKVANSSELMTSSPSTVDEKQLVELGIAVCKQEQSEEISKK